MSIPVTRVSTSMGRPSFALCVSEVQTRDPVTARDDIEPRMTGNREIKRAVSEPASIGPSRDEPPRHVATLRSLGPPVYIPTMLFAFGQGAVIPVFAIAAIELGASPAVASVIVALRGLGTMVFDIPASRLIARFGETRAMAIGTVVLLIALAGAVVSTSPLTFAVSAFVLGCGWSVWLLARYAYVTDTMPARLRGRALSLLSGVTRIGNFGGPLVGAVALGMVGIDGAFYVHFLLGVVAFVFMLWTSKVGSPTRTNRSPHIPLVQVLKAHRATFLVAGTVVAIIGILRASRQVVLALWAIQVGLDATELSLIFGISAAMDMALFYPAGLVMDRWGRKYTAIPCVIVLVVGHLVLPLTDSMWSIAAVGILMGLGNGIGSGVIMTLGADLSPHNSRAAFLGIWRLVEDIGTTGGPFLLALVVALAGIGVASVMIGVVGIFGVFLLASRMPETLQVPPAFGGPSHDH